MSTLFEGSVDQEAAREALRNAVASQKRGQRVQDLWGEMFAACGLSVKAVNRLVKDVSDGLAQGCPNLDIYSYEEFIQAKTKEHEYLLHALHDGSCFTNRKISAETYT